MYACKNIGWYTIFTVKLTYYASFDHKYLLLSSPRQSVHIQNLQGWYAYGWSEQTLLGLIWLFLRYGYSYTIPSLFSKEENENGMTFLDHVYTHLTIRWKESCLFFFFFLPKHFCGIVGRWTRNTFHHTWLQASKGLLAGVIVVVNF